MLGGERKVWSSWEDLDSDIWVRKVRSSEGRWEKEDLVHSFFLNLQLR